MKHDELNDEMRKIMGGRPIHETMLDYFTQHPNETLTITKIMKDTNETRNRIQGWITSVRNRGVLTDGKMEILIKGRAYRYIPNDLLDKSKSDDDKMKRIFVEVGITKTGDVIIECEDGTLYKAVEL